MDRATERTGVVTRRLAAAGLAALLLASSARGAAARGYNQTKLVADTTGAAAQVDANLLNPWGIAFDPAGNGRVWVVGNHSGLATPYTSAGQPAGSAVVIPASGGAGTGAPTGAVFNGTADFHGASFLTATEDGLIVGWREGAATATVEADNSASGAVYKGLALASSGTSNFLSRTTGCSAPSRPRGPSPERRAPPPTHAVGAVSGSIRPPFLKLVSTAAGTCSAAV